ncbi:MAG: hypothetical protein ACR2QF_15160 [Geminicoccaceae bacterium]
MKVQVAALLKALQRIRAVIQPTTIVDIYEAVELEITEDALFLTTASNSISATVEIAIEGGHPDIAVVKLAPFYEMARRSSNQTANSCSPNASAVGPSFRCWKPITSGGSYAPKRRRRSP